MSHTPDERTTDAARDTAIPEWMGEVADRASIPRRVVIVEPPGEEAPFGAGEKAHIPAREQVAESAAAERNPETTAPKPGGKVEDLLVRTKCDRRLLPHVPPRSNVRSNRDQRGQAEARAKRSRRAVNPSLPRHFGVRYEADFDVDVQCELPSGTRQRFTCKCKDISTNGIQLHVQSEKRQGWLASASRILLRFDIEPGIMPEGYEMRVKMWASYIMCKPDPEGGSSCGLQFAKSLIDYAYSRRGRNLRGIAIAMLAVVSLVVILMRVYSRGLFFTNRIVFIYSLVTAAYLLSRYLFGALYKPTPVNPHYTPGVSIVIPCYDEEEWIERTILSCLDQDYPLDKLEVIVVDDHSRDRSPQRIQETMAKLAEIDDLYDTVARVRYVRQDQNLGKRDAMARGTRMAKHDLVVFVDSDSFLDPYAILNIVQPFQDPKVGGVSGRTDIANSYTNWLTKMQSVKYYISFRVMKAVEGYFNAVTCLSGPLSCYRKEALEKNLDAWLNQRFLGRKATFGDDRSMTNFILREYRTDYQDTAICSTIAPNTQKLFLRQQMRWKRSWLRESTIAATFIWRKEPFMAISFYIGYIIPILAPLIVLYNMLYVPIFQGYFPTVFFIGLFSMAMLMSMTQLLMRRSKLWMYGIVYQAYYIAVLVWQMPLAWVTFWKTTWGTRMTANDIRAKWRGKRGRRQPNRPVVNTYAEDV